MGLDGVELIMAWEEEFNVEITDEIAATLVTPRMAVDAIEELLKKDPPPPPPTKPSTWWKKTQKTKPKPRRQWTREELELEICKIIVEQTGLDREDFTLDSHFIRDMGID